MKFQTSLASDNASICGGFGASGSIDPSTWADELYKGAVSGPWLCCYMIRRFGWPNCGSDDYKQLCSWNLTTPLSGLYLCVTPYLGGSNLHFSVMFNKAIGAKINQDPGRDSFLRRLRKSTMHWWSSEGRKLYVFGKGKKADDEDELVFSVGEDGEHVWGFWRRTSAHRGRDNSPNVDWLSFVELIEEFHPEVRLPKMTKREKANRISPFDKRVRAAIEATLLDLLRPTSVRDIRFTPFGNIEKTPEAVGRYSNQADAGRFTGAGHTPKYWFSHKGAS